MKINYIKNPINEETMARFVNALTKLQDNNFNKLMKNTNVERCSKGKVTAINSTDGSCTVEFSFGTKSGIYNKSGTTCSVNKFVKVYYDRDDMVGAYIGTIL